MEIFERLSKFKFEEFQACWSILIFLCNLYNFFTAGYFLGCIDSPEAFWLGLELMTEALLLIDLILRIFLTKSAQVWFLHESPKLHIWVPLILSSVPYTTIFTLFKITSYKELIALRFFKLLRLLQMLTFLKNLEMTLWERAKNFVAILETILVVLFTTHYSAMVWQFYQTSVSAEIDDKDRISSYTDAVLWASESLTGIVQNGVTIDGQVSKMITITVMAIGGILYGLLFVQIYGYFNKVRLSHSDYIYSKLTIEYWCDKRGIPSDIQERVLNYLQAIRTPEMQFLFFKFPPDVPLSLLSEISLFQYKDLIPKVKLFELGEPSFIMSLVRSFTQAIYMQGDFVIRLGDLANHMYFVNKGMLEVIATDGHSRIALLDDGNYFGEIGILLSCCRTVSVRSLITTIVACIEKDKLLGILNNFPEHKKFLMKVANQRIRTCSKEDVDINYDLVEDNYSSSDSDHSGELECPQYYAPAEHEQKKWWLRYITVPTSKAQKGVVQVDPLSPFFYMWSLVLVISYSLCVLIIPYSIRFSPDTRLLGIDAGCYCVFVIDIYVNYNSALITKFKTFTHDRNEIHKNYIDNCFIFDALAIVPADWVYLFFEFNTSQGYYLKLLRYFKLVRIVNIVSIIQTHSNISDKFVKLVVYIYCFCTFGHLTACLLNFLEGSSNTGSYVDNLYWSSSIISQSSFGYVDPGSLKSKILTILLITVSKVLYLVFFVECVILVKEKYQFFINFVKKLKIVDEWMEHCKIVPELKEKVKDFYRFKWERLKGLDDEEIIQSLPECISTDLRLNLYSGIIESGIFPTDEKGAILGIIRKCKLTMVNKTVNVINKDELGLEMFFILEGTVLINTGTDCFFKELGPGSIFGELAILEDTPRLRLATVTAKTDLTLASLSAEDFKEVTRSYSDFEGKVRQLARVRKGQIGRTHEDDRVVHVSSVENHSEMNESLFEKVEESSFEKNTLTTVIFESKTGVHPILFRTKFSGVVRSELRQWAVFMFWCWNVVFIPLQVAFQIDYSLFLFTIEAINVIFYLFMSFYYALLHDSEDTKFYNNSKNKKYLSAIRLFYLIVALPGAMIMQLTNLHSFSSILFAYTRISIFPFIFFFFTHLKEKKINWYITIQLVEIITTCISASHIFGCLFITIGKHNSPSWIDSLKNKSDDSIYLSAVYWAFGSLIHMVQGDIEIISSAEEIFACFLQIFSVFFFGILFGGLMPLIGIFGSKLRDKFHSDYSYTMTFIKQKQVDKCKHELNDYFNYVWERSRGTMEGVIADGLPETLKADLFIAHYNEALRTNETLKCGAELDVPLIRSMHRLMKFKYSLLGDVIVRVDDLNSNIYFILAGEVTIISLEGSTILSVLSNGSHFGEACFLFRTLVRTATAVATKFTHLFYFAEAELELLFNLYPEWKEKIILVAEERLVKWFGTENLGEVSKICESFSKDLSTSSPLQRKYTKQTELLISHKVAEAKAERVIDKRLTLNTIHLMLIIYSCIMIPIEIVAIKQYPSWVMALELLCFVESVLYLFTKLKSDMKLRMYEIIRNRHVITYDIAAISPLNFILPLAGISSPASIISVLRCIRLLSVFSIHSLLSQLIVYNKRLFLWVVAIETGIFLTIFMNWVTCIIYFNYGCQSNQSFIQSLYLTMNLLTFTGRTDAYPCSNTMILIVCIVGFIASGLLSVLYGLLSFFLSKFKPGVLEIYSEIIEKFLKLSERQIPLQLKGKIETYAKFSASLLNHNGETVVKEIYKHLPDNIVHDLIHEKLRHLLKKVPFLKESNSLILMKKIALTLMPEIYLPTDYLIYKDDIGEEMYFISLGSVNIISPDNSKILKSLHTGDFFGEMALINNTRRMCSVIASTLCLVYALKKNDFYEVLNHFPEVLHKLKHESENRSRETTSVSKVSQVLIDDYDEDQEKLFNHLRMFSLMSASFSDLTSDKNNSSLLTGMKNIRAGTSVDTFVKDRSQYRIYKRRPNMPKKMEKRNSQISLGKELVFERFSKLKMKWKEQVGVSKVS